uniref:Uncharacterized protein n=1 Tax=Romanomermis culicivorax TaxID=13658 RepID=A0A915K6C7_ROMCU
MSIDPSKRTGASDKMLLSMSFRKLLICVTETIRSAAAGLLVGADVGTVVGNFVILRSKIGISSSLSSNGSGAVINIGGSSNFSAVNTCAEAVVRNGAIHMKIFIEDDPAVGQTITDIPLRRKMVL